MYRRSFSISINGLLILYDPFLRNWLDLRLLQQKSFQNGSLEADKSYLICLQINYTCRYIYALCLMQNWKHTMFHWLESILQSSIAIISTCGWGPNQKEIALIICNYLSIYTLPIPKLPLQGYFIFFSVTPTSQKNNKIALE